MNAVEKSLNNIGLEMSDTHLLDQVDSFIICRIFDAVQDYAMYHDKNPELESQCEMFKSVLRENLNQRVIK